ncbi:MAG: cation:proton antiporter [Woeseiaceae bacterium]|nr:cation:proton antiporter [Woeseiaceae bacterium]
MDLATIAILGSLFLGYALVSGKLEGTVLTAPLLFVAFGFLAGSGGLGFAAIDVEHSAIHVIAELTLILVLFTDAARIDLSRVRADHNLPVRMLLIGLPLAIAAGAFVAAAMFPAFSIWEAALLAALLAPTDAALGQSVVSAKAVPLRVRQAINIESGLNDGIALPAVLLFAALAGALHGSAEETNWLQFGALQVTLGPVAGIIVGYLGAKALDAAAENGWATTAFQGIGILAVSVLAFVFAELVGGNGFISAFVGGLVFGNCLRHPCDYLFEFMESEGQLLMLVTFLVFGAALLPEGIEHIDVMFVVYGVLSLTLIRMIPIALSLIGSGIRLPTYLFLGWFGPRGLASILFVLLILEEADVPHQAEIFAITVITVALSVILHGVSASPLAKAYGRMSEQMGECEEMQDVSDVPLRSGPSVSSNPER